MPYEEFRLTSDPQLIIYRHLRRRTTRRRRMRVALPQPAVRVRRGGRVRKESGRRLREGRHYLVWEVVASSPARANRVVVGPFDWVPSVDVRDGLFARDPWDGCEIEGEMDIKIRFRRR